MAVKIAGQFVRQKTDSVCHSTASLGSGTIVLRTGFLATNVAVAGAGNQALQEIVSE
jgi:hypothetical protein